MTREEIHDVKWVRTCATCLFGGDEVVRKATDEELLRMMNWNRQSASLYNEAVQYDKFIKNTVKAIAKRPF